VRVLNNPNQFSNVVSNHLAVPNGFDPPEHKAYRHIIDSYFSAQRMTDFEPVCRCIAAKLIARLPKETDIEITTEFADVFAIEVQCAFLDWPEGSHQPLLRWTRKNQLATLSGDRAAMAAVAVEFDGYIRGLLTESRKLATIHRNDAVTRLLSEHIDDRALSDEEIVSILRNWTVGELSTISGCVAKIGDCQLAAGERITIMWASANRHEAEFGDPDEFRLDRDPAKNLLYGAGIHVCPGAPLARLELRVVMEELPGRTKSIAMMPDKKPVRAIYPASGFSSLPLRIE
jgi:cytochrome P450